MGTANAIISLDELRKELYESNIEGPWGECVVTYLDWAASGRPLKSIDAYITDHVQPYYANTHAEVSDLGRRTSAIVNQARHSIAAAVNAPRDKYAVLFTGGGATYALRRFADVVLAQYCGAFKCKSFKMETQRRPVVFVAPYEHHSNELIWRERQCEVIVLDEDPNGCPDLGCLERHLKALRNQRGGKDRLIIASISAGSNVTGIITDIDKLCVLVHTYGGMVCLDGAAAGSYHLMSMEPGKGGHPLSYKDAIAISPHKLAGGPGAAGVLVARRQLFNIDKPPTVPAGGTVLWVTEERQAYLEDIETREEGGTPIVEANIRAGMAVTLLHSVHLQPEILDYEHDLTKRLVQGLLAVPGVICVGSDRPAFMDWPQRLGIVPILITAPGNRHRDGQPLLLHHHYVACLLSDLYGIQTRSGCTCAGPYAQRLLSKLILGHTKDVVPGKFDTAADASGCLPAVQAWLKRLVARQGTDDDWSCASHGLWEEMVSMGISKPGWLRISIKYLTTVQEVDYVIAAVQQIAEHGWKLLPQYQIDPTPGLGRWVWRGGVDPVTSKAGKGHDPVPVPAFPHANTPLTSAVTQDKATKEAMMVTTPFAGSDVQDKINVRFGMDLDDDDHVSGMLIRCGSTEMDTESLEGSHSVAINDQISSGGETNMISNTSQVCDQPVPIAERHKAYLNRALGVYNGAASWTAAYWQDVADHEAQALHTLSDRVLKYKWWMTSTEAAQLLLTK